MNRKIFLLAILSSAAIAMSATHLSDSIWTENRMASKIDLTAADSKQKLKPKTQHVEVDKNLFTVQVTDIPREVLLGSLATKAGFTLENRIGKDLGKVSIDLKNVSLIDAIMATAGKFNVGLVFRANQNALKTLILMPENDVNLLGRPVFTSIASPACDSIQFEQTVQAAQLTTRELPEAAKQDDLNSLLQSNDENSISIAIKKLRDDDPKVRISVLEIAQMKGIKIPYDILQNLFLLDNSDSVRLVTLAMIASNTELTESNKFMLANQAKDDENPYISSQGIEMLDRLETEARLKSNPMLAAELNLGVETEN